MELATPLRDQQTPGVVQFKLAVAFGVFLLIFLRDPKILILGRFWAEEGHIYFSYVWNGDFWAHALRPFNGYYSLFVWAAVGLATLAPLDYAPLVTGYMALLAMMIPPLIILFAPLTLELSPARRAVGAFLLVLPSVNTGVWLNSINAQFFFALATALLLICDCANRRFFFVALPLILVAGLTGPVSIFLTPFFLLRAYGTRNRRWWIIAVLLTACALLQSSAMVLALLENVRSTGGTELLLQRAIGFLLKLHLYPFLLGGAGTVYESIKQNGLPASFPYLAASLAVLAYLLYLAWQSPKRSGLWLAAAMLLATALNAMGALQPDELSIIDSAFHPKLTGRYFMVGTLLMGVVLLLPYRGPLPLLSSMRYPLLGLLLITGALSYESQKTNGMPWRQEVLQWRSNPDHCLRIWPGYPSLGIHTWAMKLLPESTGQPSSIQADYAACAPPNPDAASPERG